MKLSSTYRFADVNIKKAYYMLEQGDDQERYLFKSIKQALVNIEGNAFCGIQLSKRLMPKEYTQKYGIENVWKYDLPGGWRLIYSIARDKIIVVSLILEWFNHKEYERRFKY
jgi:hypothetical protein